MNVYKVLLPIRGGKFKSAGSIPDWMKMTYRRGVVNRPKIKGSKMFVFKDERAAVDFNTCRGGEVWLAETKSKPIHFAQLPRVWFGIAREEVLEFWGRWRRTMPFDPDLGWATVEAYGVSDLRLIKKLEE